MSEVYSEASFGTTTSGLAAPMSAAPFCAPSYENWLKFLSSTVPTSVTTPIFSDDDGAGVAASVGALDGVSEVPGCDGAFVAPLVQALTTSARLANSVSPME